MSTPDADRLPAELRAALLAEVDPGETLRWCGQPLPSRIFRRALPSALILAAFIGLFAGMCIFGGIQSYRELSDPAVAVADNRKPGLAAAIVFTCLGFGSCFGTLAMLSYPWFARAKAARTTYALTNTRVFTLIRAASGRVQTNIVEPGHPLSISRRENADGTGDIFLYPGTQANQAKLILAGTADPRAVERLIRTTFDPPTSR